MAGVLRRVVSTARDIARGIDAGHAIRHGAPVAAGARARPGPERDADTAGGPFLHWVPDGDGGSRLAGELVPDEPPGRIPPGTAVA